MTAASSLPPSRRDPLPPGFHVATPWRPGTVAVHAERRRKRGGRVGQARGLDAGSRLVDPTMADRGAGTDATALA